MKVFLKLPRSYFLLFTILIFIFGAFIIDSLAWSSRISLALYSVIFIGNYFSVKKKSIALKILMATGIILNVSMNFIENPRLLLLVFILSAMIFIYMAFVLIGQIAKSRHISEDVIIEAVNGYLLIGVVAVLLNRLTMIFDSGAIGFKHNPLFSDYVYYSFVNLTTIGFGDISPVSSFARTISVFTGLSGQLYLSIIIALIVSKVSNKNPDE